jgi:hypothetical protein
MANSYLARTPSSTGNRKTFTFSAWVKRSKLLDNYPIMFKQVTDASNFVQFYFDNQDNLVFYVENGSGSGYLSLQITNRKFRDVSAWYHVMVAVDTTQASADNRVKIYVNGNQETSFSTNTQINQNIDVAAINTTGLIEIGRASNNSSQHFNGYMTHVSLVDGQQLAPTVFGQTDSTSGIWKFKQPSGVTWGTNGFHLKFENSGNLGLDSSGQTNNFTVNGNLKQALDTPSNVYATGNSLIKGTNGNSNGNNTSTSGQNSWETLFGTLGMETGKWYAEFKMISNYVVECGIVDIQQAQTFDIYPGSLSRGFGYRANGDVYKGGVGQSGTFATYTGGDIIGVAMDMTNNKLYLSKNGTFQNSGDPTSGASGTGALSIDSGYTYTFAFGAYNGSVSANFGNGFFGTTAITSAGSNGNGSLFEYDVPSGYYALNTKNINTYG